MWVYCLGLAEVFRQLAQRMAPAPQAKWVQIFGIATAVCAALTVTAMHDLMLNISVGFFTAAQVMLMDWLWRRRQRPRFLAGLAHLALLLVACIAHYGDLAEAVLPLLQKLTFLSSAAWLTWIHRSSERALASAPAA